MKRLTTDTPKDNIETSLNLFYVKDGWTWIRGGGPAPDYADISLNDFVRMLVKANIPDNPELPENDDDLSMMMAEWLMDDPASAEGIIALLYTAGWAFAELRHLLAAYEDTGLEPEEIAEVRFLIAAERNPQKLARLRKLVEADQQGRLVVLPCKVGDTVYRLITPKDAPAVICEKPIRTVGEAANLVGWLGKKRPLISVFASREEAERALEGGNGDG